MWALASCRVSQVTEVLGAAPTATMKFYIEDCDVARRAQPGLTLEPDLGWASPWARPGVGPHPGARPVVGPHPGARLGLGLTLEPDLGWASPWSQTWGWPPGRPGWTLSQTWGWTSPGARPGVGASSQTWGWTSPWSQTWGWPHRPDLGWITEPDLGLPTMGWTTESWVDYSLKEHMGPSSCGLITHRGARGGRVHRGTGRPSHRHSL
ncbi:hypothetical protein WMY93_029672 [Mugilogobius chulae]|uniref:Uncharacterized protein n=1 Tax=Mugilogobius chulae TaxID=88201 RepID=A0AAW0MXP1_9GOBI